MEAKDTAISTKKMEKMWKAYNHFSLASPMSKAGIKDMFDDFSPFFFEVAEASFKAGQVMELEGRAEWGKLMYRAGIKEVVGCVNGFMVLHSPGMWRRKLEEWGIEKE